MPVACQDCQKMMSPGAVVCPHCGVRQAGREWMSDAGDADRSAPGPLRVSPDEARALIITDGSDSLDYAPRGPMALILPNGALGSWSRKAEWALTLLAAPLLLAGLSAVITRWRLWGHLRDGHEVTLTFILGLFGGLGMLYVMTEAAGFDLGISLGLVGVSFGALLMRLWLRRRLMRFRTDDLT